MRLLAALIVTLALLLSACGESSDASGCVEVREPLDPLSIQHVVDADSVTFLTDPPTSGPHLSGPSASGRIDTPIAPAAQVRVLEAGGVVVQYSPSVDVAELLAVLDQTAVDAVLAPADSLPAAVVTTAWTWKLSCDSAQVSRILDFATERVSDAPGAD